MATVKQSGGDYSTLNAACVADETTISIEGTWTSADTTAVTVDTDNTTITTDADSKHSGYVEASPSYYRLSLSSSSHCITVSAVGTVIDGIVIERDGATASAEGIRLSNTTSNASTDAFTIKNSILYCETANQATDQDGIYIGNGNGTINVENTIIMGFSRCGIHLQNYSGGISCTTITNVTSCTIAYNGHDTTNDDQQSAGGIGFYHSHASTDHTANVHNSIIINNDIGSASSRDVNTTGAGYGLGDVIVNCSYSIIGDDSLTWLSATEGHTVTGTGRLEERTLTDSTSPGTGDWVIVEDFTTYPYDFRLVSNAENDAEDAHTTATAHSLTIPSTDIAGTSRPQNTSYDIGAFEIVSGGATYNFTFNRSSASTTPGTVSVDVARDLIFSQLSASTTSDAVSLTVAAIIELLANIQSQSSSADDSALNLLKTLLASVSSASTTSDAVSIDVVRDFISSIVSQSSTK